MDSVVDGRMGQRRTTDDDEEGFASNARWKKSPARPRFASLAAGLASSHCTLAHCTERRASLEPCSMQREQHLAEHGEENGSVRAQRRALSPSAPPWTQASSMASEASGWSKGTKWPEWSIRAKVRLPYVRKTPATAPVRGTCQSTSGSALKPSWPDHSSWRVHASRPSQLQLRRCQLQV